MKRIRNIFGLSGMALAALACGDPAMPAGGPTDAGPDPTRDGGSGPNGDAGHVCEPTRCQDLGDVCGAQPDGCGGILNCRPCDCTADTFATDCPSAPCRVASGCDAGRCRYEPVTCGDAVCAGPTRDDAVACGDGACPVQYCDATPSMTEEGIEYANRCVAPEDVRCGPCGLGSLACGPDGPICEDSLPLFGLDPDQVLCDGPPELQTFVFLDPTSTSTPADGSKVRPFETFEAARDAAIRRSARGIIVGGAPVLRIHTVDMIEGLSIYGGNLGWPQWAPASHVRPVFSIENQDDAQVVGFRAEGIELPTALVNLSIRARGTKAAETGENGQSSIALLAVESPGLVLDNTLLIASGSDGGDGAFGRDGPSTGAGPGVGVDGHRSTSRCRETVREHVGGAGGRAGACLFGPGQDGGAGGSVRASTRVYEDGEPAQGGAAGEPVALGGTLHVPAEDGAVHAEPRAAQGRDGLSDAAVWDDARGILSIDAGHGRPGAHGLNGRAGGGGSGGFVGNITSTTGPKYRGCRVGGSGGGGGAGGCGGEAGGGAGAGGWSVGLMSVRSAGLTVRGGQLQGGSPGRGGLGGDGGLGSAGQLGAEGGAKVDFDDYAGRAGGDGSAGQHGGDGGDGADGFGVSLWCVDGTPTLDDPDISKGTAGQHPYVQTKGCEL